MAEKLDPRFDPRFQPGYTPAPVAARAGVIRSDAASLESTVPVDADSGDTVADADEADLEGQPADFVSESNPFERTLWVVAILLVVGGVAAAFWANSLNYFGTGDAADWRAIFQSSGWALSSPMVTVGLATGVGLLFRRAASWRPPQRMGAVSEET